MSDRSCANCGAPIGGAYCASCGQETSIALPTARAFLRDAAGRYVARSMKAVYGGRWSGIVARAFVVGFLYLICFAFAMAGLVIAAVLLR